MKKKFLYLLIISIFVGCITNKTQQQQAYYKLSDTLKQINIAELEHIKNFELPIEDSRFNLITEEQILETDTGTFLVLAFSNYNKIFVYNLEKEQKVSEIVLDRTSLRSFYYVNKDSIFLFYSPHSNQYYNHDSSLVLINEKNEIKKSYSWYEAPVWCTEKEERDYEDSVSFSFLYFQKLAYSQQKILMPLSRYKKKMFGDDAFIKDKRIIVGVFETKEDKFKAVKNIYYPSITGAYKYPNTYHNKLLGVADDNQFLVTFQYTPEIFKFNPINYTNKKLTLKSTVLDSIYPFYTNEIPADYNIPEYYGINYDKNNKLYFRYIAFHNIYGKGIFTLYDANFNFVAEGVHPAKSGLFNFTKDYILAHNMGETSKAENKVIYSAYNLKYKKGTNQELIKELKLDEKKYEKTHRNVTNYFNKELNIKDKNYSATVLVWNSSCFGTMDFVLKHYQVNRVNYEKNDVYLIVTTSNLIQVKNLLKKDYNLNSDSLSNIFVVSNVPYFPFHKFKEFSPRVTVVRKKKIVSDTIYVKPNEITEDLQNILLKSSKEQKK